LDADRLSQGQLIAAVSAIALFIVSFLPWFGTQEVTTIGPGGGSLTIGGNVNMWEGENPLDIYLLIVILVALVPAGLALAGGADAPLAPIATTLLAGVGTLLIIYQLFDQPGNLGTKIGIWLGLLACAGITVGGYLAMQEDIGGERY
jgi:hypothetical protein